METELTSSSVTKFPPIAESSASDNTVRPLRPASKSSKRETKPTNRPEHKYKLLKKMMTKTRMEITLPEQDEDTDVPDQSRDSVTSPEDRNTHGKTSSSILRKKSVMFGFMKTASRTNSDLQAVEKARLSTSMGLDRTAIESIEKSVKTKKTDENVYSINKHGVGKMVVIFSEKPRSRPMTICFTFPSMALTHLHILKLMRGLVSPFPDAKIVGLQFVDRNVLHGSRGLENRWLVTLTSEAARDYVISSGLPLFNKIVKISSYDDTVGQEYDAFIKYTRTQRYLNPEAKKAKDKQ